MLHTYLLLIKVHTHIPTYKYCYICIYYILKDNIRGCSCNIEKAYGYPYSTDAGAYAHYTAADIKVLPNGFLADTPEVAHARAAHLAVKAVVASKAAYYAPAPYAAPAYAPYAAPAYAPAPYVAPYAVPYAGAYAGAYAHAPAPVTVLPSGFLADTPGDAPVLVRSYKS
uniref:Cuticle protein n=1 Tax=Cacopsylla melanoneura TaxID=428564 RepID=A0A8D9FE07_9HEMI